MKEMTFVYIWEYIVEDNYVEEFKRIYGSDGDWVKLFKKADGYISTQLHQDIANSKRYVTIDTWASKAHRDNFQIQYSQHYNLLDDRSEELTESETLIGEFTQF